MIKGHLYRFLLVSIFWVLGQHALAQLPRGLPRGLGQIGAGGGRGGGGDSLQRRDPLEDSLTLTYRYLDSARNYRLDTSISDYYRRFPIPPTHLYLGNVGTASKSLLFAPEAKSGWDPGFHAFDVYKWRLENVRFFNTTRPYTELGYMLGSQTQQMIEVLHTQNLKPHWNAALQYRLINAPGFFKNQKTNHNNYLLTSWYQSPNRRYNNLAVVLSNQLQAGENGGIQNDRNYLDSAAYRERFNIPTKIGGNTPFGRDFFSTTLTTGNRYQEFNVLMRQQYDFGRKDSLVTDSTIIPLFFPRVRFEHTVKYGSYNYRFQDAPNAGIGYIPDSAYYQDYYNINFPSIADTFSRRDYWRELINDFSIYQFPDAKNLQQFIKVGIAYQYLKGQFNSGTSNLFNIQAHGEYRNRTRNQKWDIEAFGNLYLAGYNAGNYHAYVSLQRFLGNRWGMLQLGFENSNRSPAFTYDQRSSFYLDAPKDFSAENTVHFFGTVYNPFLKLGLRADYFVVGNYLYLQDYYKLEQESGIFNVLRISANKTITLSRYWRVYTEVYLQQKAGNAAVNFPALFTRNRIAYEGNFFKNLYLATGLEMRYHTPYKADLYSPLLGRFSYQDSIRINNLPQLDAYFNFRIRTFKAYIRAENLNSLGVTNGFGFFNNNLAAPDNPYPGLVIRAGIYWTFVN